MRMISILLTGLVVAITVIIGSGGGVTAASLLTPTVAPITDPTEICRAAVDGINELRSDLVFPQHLTEENNPTPRDTDFDVMEYFTVFDHLSMDEGYALDYHYIYDGMGGSPVLYARPLNDSLPEDLDYFSHIVLDGTDASYIQMAVLLTMGEQFYLHWHSNYNDMQLICGDDALTQRITAIDEFDQPLPADIQAEASALNADLLVKRDEDGVVRVVVLSFTKWGGFQRLTFVFTEGEPFDVEHESLIYYDCGVMF